MDWDAAKSERVELHSGPMPKKTKKKIFRAVEAVKALARERIGTPPPERVVPGRKQQRTRKEKHKPTLARLQFED